MELLLERASELQELQEALVAADDGTGHVVVVQGPAGIGKTALLGFVCDTRSRERSTRPQRSWQRVRANVPVGDRPQPLRAGPRRP